MLIGVAKRKFEDNEEITWCFILFSIVSYVKNDLLLWLITIDLWEPLKYSWYVFCKNVINIKSKYENLDTPLLFWSMNFMPLAGY